jgi:segregation and condensation protein B
MSTFPIKLILEALLISSDEPLSIQRLIEAFPDYEKPSVEQIQAALNELTQDYGQRSFELKELATGFSLQTKVHYAHWINQLHQERPHKYTNALLETLAVIAYRQPVTRAEIEEIRGVSISTSIIKTLMEREWVRVAGQRDVPGRPSVYVTTKAFLDYFNLKSLKELPFIEGTAEEQNEFIT